MNARVNLVILVAVSTMIVTLFLTGCSETIKDTATEMTIKPIPSPDPSLTKVKVQTDGMLADLGYDNGRHPFSIGHEVLVDKNYYKTNMISRGDIVWFRIKETTEHQDTDIARVVGLPGETVNVKKGQVYINGKSLDAFYGNDTSMDKNDSLEKPLTLHDNEFFILADIRWRGFNDSQQYGPYSRDEILGKVIGY
ncbi:signal peptidase I [Paenibacillus sp. PR3]|uniref:Signal peptidase I n=1 Tax=Paenibacillus terricola TaxID=2763503 RepID=A0ABR8N0I6_9BACL|nr:signal peptidase I [Paenibacillus terricola]MBD3921710.1 signal peptidase I [Paenibacillus terricola]